VKPLRAEDPAVIGGYRLLGTLGAGGMGRVYLARSPGGRTVAVKVIRPDYAQEPAFRTRFRREVEAARRVSGLWTAPVLDADSDAEHPYLVTSYIPGPSLGQAVADRGPLPAPTVRALGAGLAEALIAMHDTGLVHRDLKPSNVILSLDGPRVIDFGIARAIDASVLTGSGGLIGSPAYMAPEQVEGTEVSPASDVFALGSVLVFAATGAGPFDGPAVATVLHGVLSQEPDLAAVPVELRDLVGACLHKNAAARPSPRAVRSALAPAGAAGLMAAGWLPPDLVTSLSRQALALLDLDVPTGPGFSAGPDPGTTIGPARGPGTWPSPGGTTAAAPYPWPAPPGAPLPPGTPIPAETPRPAGTPIPAGTPVPPGTPLPPGTPAGPGMPFPAGTPGSFPGAVPAIRPASGRSGNQLILVAAAGALSVAVIGLVVALLVIHGSGGHSPDSDGQGPRSGAATTTGPTSVTSVPADGSVPRGSAPPLDAGTPRPGPLPAGYAGTWAGDVTTWDGLLTSHVVLTLTAGNSGQTLGHAASTLVSPSSLDGSSITCEGDLRFSGLGGPSGDEVVVVDLPGSGDNPTVLGLPVCSQGGTTRLRLGPDGQLTYASDDEAGGYPAGHLRRQK